MKLLSGCVLVSVILTGMTKNTITKVNVGTMNSVLIGYKSKEAAGFLEEIFFSHSI